MKSLEDRLAALPLSGSARLDARIHRLIDAVEADVRSRPRTPLARVLALAAAAAGFFLISLAVERRERPPVVVELPADGALARWLSSAEGPRRSLFERSYQSIEEVSTP